MTGRRGRRCKQLLDDVREKRGYCKLKKKKRSPRSHSVENWVWKRLRACRKTQRNELRRIARIYSRDFSGPSLHMKVDGRTEQNWHDGQLSCDLKDSSCLLRWCQFVIRLFTISVERWWNLHEGWRSRHIMTLRREVLRYATQKALTYDTRSGDRCW